MNSRVGKVVLVLSLMGMMGCTVSKKESNWVKVPYFNSEDFTPIWDSSKVNHRIQHFDLINQNGQRINQDFVKGKLYIADFFFTTCPGICPKLTQHMYMLQEHFKNNPNVVLISHSVMPDFDTPQVLAQYAQKNKVDSSKWQLLTGNEAQIYKLARESYFADEDFKKTKDADAFVHTENFILVDQKGRIRGVYNGTLELETQRAIRHMEALLHN